MDPKDIQVGEEVLYTVTNTPYGTTTGFLVKEGLFEDVVERKVPVDFFYLNYRSDEARIPADATCYIVKPYNTLEDYEAGIQWQNGFVVLPQEVQGRAPKQSAFTSKERREQVRLAKENGDVALALYNLHREVIAQELAMKREKFSPEAYPWGYAERYAGKHREVLSQEVLKRTTPPMPDLIFLQLLLDSYPPEAREQVLVGLANNFLREEKIRTTNTSRRKAYQMTRGKQPLAALYFSDFRSRV